jgi:hypothetical protein
MPEKTPSVMVDQVLRPAVFICTHRGSTNDTLVIIILVYKGAMSRRNAFITNIFIITEPT